MVDDQVANRRLLSALLEAQGIRVLSASSGEDALAVLSGDLPDLMLLDVMMPGLDGIEVCKKVRADPRTVLLPVVLLTALDGRDDKIRGIEAGADDFLSKPVDKQELNVRIGALLKTQDLRRKLEDVQLSLEIERRERISSTFRRYVAPELVDHILSRPALESPFSRHQRCRAVILFADLRGFTAFSERLPADTVVARLNEFYSVLSEIAHQNSGTIFNMAGDCLLVAFNVLAPQLDGVHRAILSAEEMLTKFHIVSNVWRVEHGSNAGLGIGINEGDVVAGNVGSDRYMNFTLIGDAVNTASRLKDRARAGEILFPQAILSTPLELRYRERLLGLPPMRLRGRISEVKVFAMTVLPRGSRTPGPSVRAQS